MADARSLKRILTRELNPFLYPDNDRSLIGMAKFDPQGAESDVVEVQESQDQPTISENESSFPLSVSTTEHSNKTYKIDTLRSHPTFIEDMEEMRTNFSIRENELMKHVKSIETQYVDKIYNLWAEDGSATIQRTTGALSSFALNGSMTGTRRSLTREDWVKAISTLAKQQVPTDNLVALIDEVMFWEIQKLDEFSEYQKTGVIDPVRGGAPIGELMGVKLFKRNGVPFYDSAATSKLSYLDSDGTRHLPAGAENLSVMMFNPEFVRYSLGNQKVYIKTDDPQFQGTLLSTNLRCGAVKSRIDEKGVVNIVQANS